jgi:organic radical activating enzyme
MLYKYAHIERFSNKENTDYKKYSGKLILYGASNTGSFAAHALRKRGIEFICFCDSNPKKHNTKFNDHDVISPNELRNKYPDVAILITTSRHKQIFDELTAIGYTKVLDCISLFKEIDFEGFETSFPFNQICRLLNRYYEIMGSYFAAGSGKIRNICFLVTERCNLRCSECHSLMQFFKNPIDFDFDNMKKSLTRIMSIYNHLDRITISGGETFLYKNLSDVLNLLFAYNNYDNISIPTNGTIVPDDILTETLKNPKVYVKISDYGSLSKKMDELLALFSKKGFKHERAFQGTWYKRVKLQIFNRNEDELKSLYVNCCYGKNSTCAFLSHGRLYMCIFSANAERLEAIPFAENDSIDLLDEHFDKKKTMEEIASLFNHKDYIEACKYCNGAEYDSEPVPVAEQAENPLPYQKIA